MIRSLLTRTLAASALFVVCMTIAACDNDTTGPAGEQPRAADPNVPPTPAPAAEGDIEAGGGAQPPTRPGG